MFCLLQFPTLLMYSIDRRGCGYVQASPVPTHSYGFMCMSQGYVVATSFTNTEAAWIFRYRPDGPDSDFDYSTQSCTDYEPTSMRAIRARYDPYEQTRGRVEQLKALGHSVDKVLVHVPLGSHWSYPLDHVEFIVMGGTFMSMPEDYRNAFVAQLRRGSLELRSMKPFGMVFSVVL